MANALDMSVVIGFRDWGVRRIQLAVESIFDSFGSCSGEVIISDYGSSDPEPVKKIAEETGAVYVHTAGDPVWSRSRALNAGFANSSGELLISTDADMVFTPQAMQTIHRTYRASPVSAFFLQCRDLPEGLDDAYLAAHGTDWEHLEEASRLRPRWGMGGMMAISREGFASIRGFDERLHTYGGEDLDFAQRARRAGYRTVWIDDPAARMYHMWHPSTLKAVDEEDEGRAAVAANRAVVYKDKTFVRNAVTWMHAVPNDEPLVTVAIVTKDRSALLREAIQSVLAQTVQDFEIIVVDDGSTDDTEDVVRGFADDRIHFLRQEHAGISAARNAALDVSRGRYTAVLDDDDLMHPRRLEWQLESLDEGTSGSVGSFVNFDDSTGEMALIVSHLPSVATAFEKGSAPGHGTWMISTDLLRRFRYDETLTSGVDNNLMLRLLRSGVRIAHSAKPLIARRMHELQVTVTDGGNQNEAAVHSLRFLNAGLDDEHRHQLTAAKRSAAYPEIASRDEMLRAIEPYLPDHLVHRQVVVNGPVETLSQPMFDGDLDLSVVTRDEVEVARQCEISGASYRDLGTLRKMRCTFEAFADHGAQQDRSGMPHWIFAEVGALLDDYPDRSNHTVVVVGSRELKEYLPSAVEVARTDGHGTETLAVAVLERSHAAQVMAQRNAPVWFCVSSSDAEEQR